MGTAKMLTESGPQSGGTPVQVSVNWDVAPAAANAVVVIINNMIIEDPTYTVGKAIDTISFVTPASLVSGIVPVRVVCNQTFETLHTSFKYFVPPITVLMELYNGYLEMQQAQKIKDLLKMMSQQIVVLTQQREQLMALVSKYEDMLGV